MNKLILCALAVFLLVFPIVSATTYLNYPRFDVYIDDAYYNTYKTNLDRFFNDLHSRYILMEQYTGWSSEQSWGKKLEIRIRNTTTGCTGGLAVLNGGNPYAQISLSDPFPNPLCRSSYREGGVWKLGYPGPWGDYWQYFAGALHEINHVISPKAIAFRSWLTEGWATYNSGNILVMSGDINQETIDYNTYTGTNFYNWAGYVANDYHDTAPSNSTIQRSAGYSITAWMFTMLRDNYSLSLPGFYDTMEANSGLLDYTFNNWGGMTNYSNFYSDMVVLDVFEKALGQDTYPIFRYDGPSGPGWGVRQWYATTWYPDAAVSLSFSNNTPNMGDTVDLIATVSNNGDSPLSQVSVRFYNGTYLIDEQFVDIAGQSNTIVNAQFTAADGTYSITAFADEQDVKIEQDDTNNFDTEAITFAYIDYPATADASADVVSGIEPVHVHFDGTVTGNTPLTYSWDFDNDGTTDAVTEDAEHTFSAGTYNVNFTVTDRDGDIAGDIVTITVDADTNPVASIATDKTSGHIPLTVSFDGSVADGNLPLSYEWDFDNDGTTDATTEDGSFTYNTEGDYTAELTVTDADGDVSTATVEIHATVPKADLVVTGMSLLTPSPAVGKPVFIKFTIKNIGEVLANGIIWYLDSGSVDEDNLNNAPYDLLPGAEMTTNAWLSYASAGDYIVTVSADSPNSIVESDESNNQKQINIMVI